MRVRSLIAGVATAAALLGMSVPVASGLSGLDPAMVQSMIPSTVPVPAGTTTTVDLGVPVDAAYSGAGWSVSSSGTSVTVTAPNEPGSQISVPASAAGYSATITLVAEGSAAFAPADPAPARQTASAVDSSQAKKLYLDGVIEGNVLRVRLPLNQVSDVMPLVNASRDGVKLRYLDSNGQIIKGVERDIKVAERSITLTYPEGQNPDDPFIMEVVRDDSVAEFYAIITATSTSVAQDSESAAANQQSSSVWWTVGGAIALVLVLAGLLVWRGRR
ncbi:hypothetical protein ACXZ66_07195 [Corynebacterium sp. S7]